MSMAIRFLLTVFVLITHSDSLLLVKQSDASNTWGLAGGFLDYETSSIDEAAIDYVKDQTGIDVELSRIVGIYRTEDEEIAIVFHAEIKNGDLVLDPEYKPYAGVFALNGLPELEESHIKYVEDYLRKSDRVLFGSR